MLKCRDFAAGSSALLSGELTWRQRLSMRMHWLMCHHCRRFLRQLRWLVIGAPAMHAEASEAEVERVLVRVREMKDRQD